MSSTDSGPAATREAREKQARDQLDAHAREIVQWHFHESTGCPFWLQKKSELKFDPLAVQYTKFCA